MKITDLWAKARCLLLAGAVCAARLRRQAVCGLSAAVCQEVTDKLNNAE
jgi:hypothetical protein